MDARAGKVWTLIVVAIIVAAVLVFFRKPAGDASSDLLSQRQSVPSQNMTQDAFKPDDDSALRPSQSNGETEGTSLPVLSESLPNSNGFQPSAQSDVPSLPANSNDKLTASSPLTKAGFVRPSVRELPPEGINGRAPRLTRMVDVPAVVNDAEIPTNSSSKKPTIHTVAREENEKPRPKVAKLTPQPISPNVGEAAKPSGEKYEYVEEGPPRYHRIVDGDTLEKIAVHYFGSPDRAEELFELNRNVLKQSDLLPLRIQLLIPPVRVRRAVIPPADFPPVASTSPLPPGESGSVSASAVPIHPVPEKDEPKTFLVPVPQ